MGRYTGSNFEMEFGEKVKNGNNDCNILYDMCELIGEGTRI